MLNLKEFTCTLLTLDLPYSFFLNNSVENSVMVIVPDFRSEMSAFREAA